MIKTFLLFIFPVALLASQSNPTRDELLQTVAHIEQLAQETQDELTQEKQAHAQTQQALDTAQKSNQAAQLQFSIYQKNAEAEIAKGNSAIQSLAHVVKKLHTAKYIMSGLWLALCGFAALRFGSLPILGTFTLYGIATLGAAGVTFIWLWI